MGTRNLTVVYHDGQYKVAKYCQWDGYPSGQGATAYMFLKNKFNRRKFLSGLAKVKNMSDDELDACYKKAMGVVPDSLVPVDDYKNFTETYPYLGRDTGSNILEAIQNDEVITQNSLDFVKDGLFCEWVYVLDLDSNSFEIYTGCYNTASENNRFTSMGGNLNQKFRWKLKHLPKSLQEFLRALSEKKEA